jgi:hypothetical protein
VLVMTGVALLGPVGAAQAQEVLPPDDPSISYQELDPLPTESGCPQDPLICQGGQGVDSLPVTGPSDQLLRTAAIGGGLLLVGAAGVVAGRRRTT